MSCENVAAASTCARSGSGYSAIGDTIRSSSAGEYDGGGDELSGGLGGVGSGAWARVGAARTITNAKDSQAADKSFLSPRRLVRDFFVMVSLELT
jgi:hypothetical protein